ncbi:MAG: WbqC family protein [Deltaproteobacteria bacterium]|nr:WbqC family protein [Deltaproteobacteria bacterium]
MSTEKMVISVNQPYFFPFVDFFYKAYLSDKFVILDNVQFPRGTTWMTRNRFKNAQGSLWMTVPVIKKGLGLQKIDAVRISHDGRWAKKHLRSLKNAYVRAPYFREHLNFLEDLFSTKFEKLIHLNLKIIRYLMQQLQVDTNVILSSELGTHMKGDKLLLEICSKLGASQLLVQKAAKKYITSDRLSSAGIKLGDFRPPAPVYPQLWGDFIPNLSALDLILNCGPKAHDIMTLV